MIKAVLPHRTTDTFGSGDYGASRGKRKHNGRDYACAVGSAIMSPVGGKVTKIGYPYGDDLRFRYVEVTKEKLRHRIFYIEPFEGLQVGDLVTSRYSILGYSQELGHRYPSITEHIHYEVKDENGNYHDPEGADHERIT